MSELIENSYAGLSKIQLEDERFDLGHGVYLSQTYAHLISTNLMAFKPAPQGEPHPRPWRAVEGHKGQDIHVELCVPNKGTFGDLSPQETIWWIAALLRIAHYPYLVVSVISSRPFDDARNEEHETLIRPVETRPRLIQPSNPKGETLQKTHLEWVRETWPKGAELLAQHPKLKTAIHAWDMSTTHERTSSSLLAVWGALEQLFSPSSSELRFRVSSYIASYLHPPGPERLATFKRVANLYNARSTAAHTAKEVDKEALIESYIILRNVLIQMISKGKVPSTEHLEALLFGTEENADWEQ